MPAAALIRYLLVGGLGTAAHLATLGGAVELLGLPVLAGSIAGFLVALGLSYLLNRHWTFGTGRPGLGSLWRYTLVCAAGLGLNIAMMYALVHWLQWRYMTAQLSVIFVVPVSNFLLSRHWAFASERRDHRLRAPR